ncbi:MAG: hypothetical protein N2249_00355 [Melioribacter sp.]|nr:hypothetical protein [Melioribacter sp.]
MIVFKKYHLLNPSLKFFLQESKLNRIFIFTIFFLAILINSCSVTKNVTCNWKVENINVDGKYYEWQNKLINIEDYNVSIGFQNDEKYLYMCLVINEPLQIIQMFRGGFIIWFIPDDDTKTIGLKYPLGSYELNYRNEELELRKERMPKSDNTNRRGNLNVEKMIERLLEKETNFQIIDKSKYPLWLYPLENNQGIKPKISFQSIKLIYELQIPITNNSETDFKIPVSTGEKLKIKFETEEINQENFSRAKWEGSEGGFQRPAGLPPRKIAQSSFNREPLNFSVKLTLVKQK